MKSFKKIAAIFSATALIGCACALSACGSGSVGVIGGNYKEATPQEVTQAATTIDQTKLLGDTSAKDWKFGLDMSAHVDFKLDVPNLMNASAKADANYKLSIAKTETASLFSIPYDVKGSGKFKASYKVTASGQSESETSEAAIYNDNSNVYVAMDDLNVKMSFEAVMDMVEDIFDGIGDSLPGTGMPDVDIPELGDLEISDLAELGFKTYLDTSKGTKIKISATADTFNAIMVAAGYTLEQVSFSSTTLDLYLAVDKDGVFSGVGVNFNIGLSVKTSTTTTATFSLKGGVAVKAFNGTVKLPDNLDGYTDLSQSMGGIFG